MGRRWDRDGNLIEESPAAPPTRQGGSLGMRGRRMRPVAERATDPNQGVREQAQEQIARRVPRRWDRDGNLIQPDAGAVEAANAQNARRGPRRRSTPVVRGDIVTPVINLARDVGDYLTSNTDREEGAGEVQWQSVPEQNNVRWEGGILSPALNALPREARSWLDAQGRANNIGAGYFLDFNQEHREQIIRHNVPDAEFRDDRWGNRMARMSPQQPWAYINRPGFSSDDAITLAGEVEKYIYTRRLLPGGGNLGASPLGTTMAREGVAGGLTTALGQTAAMAVGGPGPDVGDIAGSTAGSAAGGALGHVVSKVIAGGRSVPGAVQRFAQWVDDRMPSGAQRAAERTAQTEADIAARVAAARTEAADRVRAQARQQNLTGERLQRAVAEAEGEAESRIAREIDQSGPGEAARALNRLAERFGVRLTRAQAENDPNGVRFLYDAAQGHYGRSAQQLATGFLEEQGIALPAAIRGIAGDASVANPQAGVSRLRTGLESAQRAGTAEERASWDAFRTHADARLRTFDVTPAGNPGGVTRVRDNMLAALPEEGVYMQLPEYATNYPNVASVLSLTERMAAVPRETLPLHDVNRVIELKRFIDSVWENANRAERGVLTRLGRITREWLRDASGYNEGVPANLQVRAPQTAARLRESLALSQRNARAFRDNPIISDMLERGRPAVDGSEGHLQMTDQEVTQRLFGGGDGGLTISGDSLEALRSLKETLGASSPEWQALRQAALQRLTQGLDQAIVTRQTPLIVTTLKRIENAFNANGEAMNVLFTVDELVQLRQAQRIVQALAPPGRNPVNASGSADTALRVGRGLLEMVTRNLKGVPFGPGEISRAAENTIAGARLNSQLAGAGSEGSNIARAVADLWNVQRSTAGVGGATGQAYANVGPTSVVPDAGTDYRPPEMREVVTTPADDLNIDTSRPAIENGDGSYSTERTITIEVDGRYYVIPSIVGGRALSEEEATDAWRRGANPEVHSPFDNLGEAEAYARWRSASIPAARQAAGATRY